MKLNLKLYFKIVGALLFLLSFITMIIPDLVSAPDTGSVLIGAGLMLALFPASYYLTMWILHDLHNGER
jgi:hypothetical protein